MKPKTLCSLAIVAISMVAFLTPGVHAQAPALGSGFLPNNGNLQSAPLPGDPNRLLWENPKFQAGQYNAILLAPIQFYPEPQPSEYVSAQTLTAIQNYADQSARQAVGQRFRIADKPGPGVARVRAAVTAIGTQTEALKPYQFIPIGLALTAIMDAAQGGPSQQAKVAYETLITDCVSGEVLLMSVRGGTGQVITAAQQGQRQVSLADVKPVIDLWVGQAIAELANHIKGK